MRISRTKKVEMPLFSGFPGRTVLESAFPGFFGCFFSGCGGRGLRLIKTQLQTSEGGQLCIGGKEDQQSAGRKVEQRAVCALGGGFYAGGGALKGAAKASAAPFRGTMYDVRFLNFEVRRALVERPVA